MPKPRIHCKSQTLQFTANLKNLAFIANTNPWSSVQILNLQSSLKLPHPKSSLWTCRVINVRTLTLIPKITRSEENSPAVSTASSDRGGSGNNLNTNTNKRGFLRSRKSMKAPPVADAAVAAANAAAAAKDEAEAPAYSPRVDEAPVIRDQAIRGI